MLRDRCALLIDREALLGGERFTLFPERLGRLVDGGVLARDAPEGERAAYREVWRDGHLPHGDG